MRLHLLLPAPAVLVAAALLASPALAADLEVHFLDVDQGNAALVIGPDGTTVLIDGGNPGDGSGDVVPYLTALGLTGLDYSVMTHWHTDHYGGLDEVFNAGFQPAVAAYDRGSTNMPSGTQVTQYLAAVGAKRQTATLGLTLPLGEGATLEVVAVNGTTTLGSLNPASYAQEENGRSVAVVVRWRDFDCYIGGDLTSGGNGTANVEGWAATAIGPVEVALASHHGSNTSSSQTVVGALDPSLVVHSCGLDNSYGHPATNVVNRWNTPAASRPQWGTTAGDTANGSGGWVSAEGAVVVVTDGWRFHARPAGLAPAEAVEFGTHEESYAGPGPGGLAITEVLVDPAGSADTYGEWFELTNLTRALVDLHGVSFTSGGKTFVLASHILLGYHERVVLGLDGHRSRNGDLFVASGAPFGDFALANGGGTLEVRAPGGALVDSVTWGGGGFPVVAGAAAERVDPFAPGTAANFQTAAGAWAGGDKGSPWAPAAGEQGAWPAGLVVPVPHVGTDLELRLAAPSEPSHFYFAGLSSGTAPGFDALGLHVPLNPDALFLAFLGLPGAFSALDASGHRTVRVAIPNDPSYAGLLVFSSFATLTFGPGGLVGSDLSNLVLFVVQ